MSKKPKILFWDIETTNLKADFGTVLCVGYSSFEDKIVRCPSILNFPGKFGHEQDRVLLAHISKILSEADCWVTYYGTGFDVKFLQTRLLKHNLPLLPPVPHVDLYYLVRNKLQLSRKSLVVLSGFLQSDNQKTRINYDAWLDAGAGDNKAMKEIVTHCKQDVLVLKEMYLKLRGLFVRHPRIYGYGPCHVCGSFDIQRRGSAISKLRGIKQRIHCRNCGSWENRSLNKKEEQFWGLKKRDFTGLTGL